MILPDKTTTHYNVYRFSKSDKVFFQNTFMDYTTLSEAKARMKYLAICDTDSLFRVIKTKTTYEVVASNEPELMAVPEEVEK